jgi:hypothetical protein
MDVATLAWRSGCEQREHTWRDSSDERRPGSSWDQHDRRPEADDGSGGGGSWTLVRPRAPRRRRRRRGVSHGSWQFRQALLVGGRGTPSKLVHA